MRSHTINVRSALCLAMVAIEVMCKMPIVTRWCRQRHNYLLLLLLLLPLLLPPPPLLLLLMLLSPRLVVVAAVVAVGFFLEFPCSPWFES